MSITYAQDELGRIEKRDGYPMRRVWSLIVMEIWWVSNVDNGNDERFCAMTQKIRQTKPFNVDVNELED